MGALTQKATVRSLSSRKQPDNPGLWLERGAMLFSITFAWVSAGKEKLAIQQPWLWLFRLCAKPRSGSPQKPKNQKGKH